MCQQHFITLIHITMELYINDLAPIAAQFSYHLVFDANCDLNKPYRIAIPLEYFADFFEDDIFDFGQESIKAEHLDGTDWTDHAQTIYEGYLNGKYQDIIVKKLYVTGYKFHKKEGGAHSICVKTVGCPVAFLQKEQGYKSFEAIYS